MIMFDQYPEEKLGLFKPIPFSYSISEGLNLKDRFICWLAQWIIRFQSKKYIAVCVQDLTSAEDTELDTYELRIAYQGHPLNKDEQKRYKYLLARRIAANISHYWPQGKDFKMPKLKGPRETISKKESVCNACRGSIRKHEKIILVPADRLNNEPLIVEHLACGKWRLTS
jgi:hypothetical protein